MDTYFTKVQPFCVGMMVEASNEERERKGDELVRAVEREIEPLLVVGDGTLGPYFGGSERLTLAEVCHWRTSYLFLLLFPLCLLSLSSLSTVSTAYTEASTPAL